MNVIETLLQKKCQKLDRVHVCDSQLSVRCIATEGITQEWQGEGGGGGGEPQVKTRLGYNLGLPSFLSCHHTAAQALYSSTDSDKNRQQKPASRRQDYDNDQEDYPKDQQKQANQRRIGLLAFSGLLKLVRGLCCRHMRSLNVGVNVLDHDALFVH